jgi:hypothetical protein
MRIFRKRHAVLAVLALALASVPATAGLSPAHAATYCEYYYGPSPSAEVDLNDDGNPEVRVPSLSNVSVCAHADVLVHGEPLRVENCSGWFGVNCWRVYVHAQAGVTVGSGLEICRSVDGGPQTCTTIDQAPWTYYTPDVNRICIGIDLNGGFPCSGGALVGFE